jgi:hypothetical protein
LCGADPAYHKLRKIGCFLRSLDAGPRFVAKCSLRLTSAALRQGAQSESKNFQKVSAQLEVNKAAPQIVVNNQ